MKQGSNHGKLKKFLWLAAFSVFMLFFFGGLVRATESGMGCPDWPRCFGQWIPPLSEADLPENYQEIFLEKRKESVDKFVKLLNQVGLHKEAELITSHPSVMEAHAYSFKTAYIEYVNRIFGVLSGFFVMIALVLSFIKRRELKTTLGWTVLGFLLVVVNGWFGSKVVNTNLVEGVVTLHFLLAFVGLAFLVMAYKSVDLTENPVSGYSKFNIGVIGLLVMVAAQMLLGAWVRETVEYSLRIEGVAITLDNYGRLGAKFNVHRILSFVILGAALWQGWVFTKYFKDRKIEWYAGLSLIAVTVLQVLTGVLNVRLGFPALAQVLHVTLGAYFFTVQFYICTPILMRRRELSQIRT